MTRILVIEDDNAVRKTITTMLVHEGFSVIEASDGNVGITLARQHLPDLIICDVQMPEMDGYEVIRSLQSDDTTSLIPFIFLTALADRQSVRMGMELGAHDYLTKPFTSRELMGTVRASASTLQRCHVTTSPAHFRSRPRR